MARDISIVSPTDTPMATVASVEAVAAAIAALPSALDYTDIKQISCGYGSNQVYTVSANPCKVHWITIWHQYNTKQFSYLRDNTTTKWYFSHMALQYKPYHYKFDPPLVFATSCTINIAAMGRAMICYKDD